MLSNSLITKDVQRSISANGPALIGRIPALDVLRTDPVDSLRNSAVVEGVQIVPSGIAKRLAASWHGMSAEIVQVTQREKFEFRFRAKTHLLVIHEQGARSDGETFVQGLPKSSLRDFRQKLTFVPAGHEYRESHDPRALARVIFVYIDPASIPVRAETGEAPSFQPKVLFENAALRETAVKLAAAIDGGFADDASYLEALGAVLMHELVRLSQGVGARQLPARGGLASWQQRAVTAYIEEHLEETIPLARLADLARLSQYYFCRAFKESLGLPPHRYHIMRRIERAKTMLANAALSVTEIGLAVGFSETSSFTASFRKVTGQTPTSYRRSFA